MKVRELKGIKSLRVLNAFSALMLGMKMLPAYMGESYEDFLGRVQEMPEADQEKILREAVLFVELQKDEIEAVCSFAEDKNGVAYSAESLRNLPANEVVDIVVAVCLAVAKIKIDLVPESEKKNLRTSQSTLSRSS